VDNNLIALRSFFNWCRSLNKMAVNPASQQRHGVRIYFDAESPRKDTYTEAQYHRIVDTARDKDRLVFRILANTGLRSSELAMLEWGDIDNGANVIHIRRKTTHDGENYSPKDNTDRAVPINQVVHSALNALRDGNSRSGYVVPLPAVKSRMDYFERSYLKRLKDLSGKTRITDNKLTLHNFRRFFVSQCADCGVPMATVIGWVGHDEMRMVMHYYRLRDESAQKAMAKFRTDGHVTVRPSADPDARTDEREGGPPSEKSDGRRKRKPKREGGATDRHRTTPDDLEHLGSGESKTASPQRKRG
jgi:integrase